MSVMQIGLLALFFGCYVYCITLVAIISAKKLIKIKAEYDEE